jgi:hypothetical protein
MKSGDLLKRVLGLPADASDDVCAHALRRALEPAGSPQATGGPQAPMDFLDGVARLTELGMDYGEAASLVSREAPELYAKHVEQSQLN